MDFNSIWVADHLNMNNETPILEGLTTLSWASNISKRLRFGHIHYNNLLRNPSLTAKMYSTLDGITEGRMNFFIDGGHPGTKNEVESYGYNFLSDTERIKQLEEAINAHSHIPKRMAQIYSQEILNELGLPNPKSILNQYPFY